MLKSLDRFTGAMVAIGAAIVPIAAAAQSPPASPDEKASILRVIEAQQSAWNRGDIDGFMNGYARSADTTFVSGNDVTRGWQTVLDRYKAKYSTREKMGTLTFSELEIRLLRNDIAVVLGRWELKRASDNPHGRFTLIFQKTADDWRIVHDHTSVATPP